MSRIEVCPATKLEPGDRHIVETDNGEIGVFNVDDEYYAVRNVCPHRGGPVCTGKVKGALVGEWPGVGQRIDETFDDKPAITCPWHGWDFDLDSGKHVGDDSIAIPTYDVVVEDDIVFLDL